MGRIRVGINGYGTIGKRVADAIEAQQDMSVAGIVKIKPDYESSLITKKGQALFAANAEALTAMSAAGLRVNGTINDLLKSCDIIVDCTPEGTGAKNRLLYEKAGVKVIFQGGEKPSVAEVSFVAEVNYKSAIGKRFVRVVSCNTTALSRTIHAIDKDAGVAKARAVIIRRGADPNESKKGPINSLIPNPVKLPSHHAEDVRTVLPGLDIFTSAVIVPTTLMHVHAINLELKRNASAVEIEAALSKSARVRLIDASLGLDSTAAIIEYARDMKRPRNDVPEVAVWRDSISVRGNELDYLQAVHQESIVVPENVDAIRAMCETDITSEESIELTNKSLGLA